jgi:hypothetical protein
MAVTHPGQLAAPAAESGFTAGVGAWLRAAGRCLARPNRRSAASAAVAPIGPAERVLATGHDLAGWLVVATSAAVYFQDRGGPGRTWSRLGWEDVDVVRWHDRHQVLAFTGVHPGGMWRKELMLASRSTLVDVARERVASTLLASTAVWLGDQPCARVTARRQPGSGKVVWIVVLNEAASISNPAIRARVAAAIAALQADTGIPIADDGDPAWLSPAAPVPAAMPGGHAEDARPVADRRSTPGPGAPAADVALFRPLTPNLGDPAAQMP